MFSPVPIFPEYSLNRSGLSLFSWQSYSHSSIQEKCGLSNTAPWITVESIIDHILTVVAVLRIIVEGAAYVMKLWPVGVVSSFTMRHCVATGIGLEHAATSISRYEAATSCILSPVLARIIVHQCILTSEHV